jgi:hypothetical protein
VYSSTIARLTSVEFFAAMPPGLFVCMVAFTSFSVEKSLSSCDSLWKLLLALAVTLRENPIIILFALFAAFICGSIIRSIPARWAEYVISFGRSPFPYHSLLKDMLDQMEKEADASYLDKTQLPNLNKMSSITFNYWKDVLCVQSPEAFSFYQTYEARSRFFTGMFWAGAAGFLGSMFMAYNAYLNRCAIVPSLQLFSLSAALILTFGLQIRHVREQEVQVLLTLFIAVMQQKHPVQAKP